MILNDFLDAVQLLACKSTAALEADRVEQNFASESSRSTWTCGRSFPSPE